MSEFPSPLPTPCRVALVQMEVLDGAPRENLGRVLEFMESEPADLWLLPELWSSGYAHDQWARIADDHTEALWQAVGQRAREAGTWVGGSAIERDARGRLVNRFRLVGPEGTSILHYDKAHLFAPMHEDRHLARGESRTRIALGPWVLSPSICFDLRFPEMYRAEALEGANLYVVASAWPAVRRQIQRGLAWARAVENQAWLVLANRVGSGYDGTRFGGGSLVVSPDGTVLAEGGEDEEIVRGELDTGALALRGELEVLTAGNRTVDDPGSRTTPRRPETPETPDQAPPERSSPNQVRPRGPSTRSVWGGESPDAPEGATVPPVFFGVTYAYDDLDAWRAAGQGRGPGYIYSRNRNPTVELFEAKVQALDGAQAATSFATGMAAVSNTLHTLLSPGDRVVSIRDTYGGTGKIFTDVLPRLGVEVALCRTDDHDALEEEVGRGCRLLYLETPTNPTLKVLDIRRLARAARAAGAVTVVDNTFATPINQRPLELGADLVIYSATKFLGGHSDAMGGVVTGTSELVQEIFHYREINGASLDPMSAFLLARGLRTLELRVERHNANALAVARFLADHPRVEAVFYPGLPDHPGHAVAREQMSGFGGVLSFSLKGDSGNVDPARDVDPAAKDVDSPRDVDPARDVGSAAKDVDGVLRRLRLAHRAASLGSVATLVGPPATTSHVEMSAAERAEAGIPETLIRYSVGIENADDLIRDLEAALEG